MVFDNVERIRDAAEANVGSDGERSCDAAQAAVAPGRENALLGRSMSRSGRPTRRSNGVQRSKTTTKSERAALLVRRSTDAAPTTGIVF
ncbi:hypothetical protein DMJ13_07445 [halophilic archaeon]|nr:hypothetical protein DMJ13_07445 [halophilic archaeon]